MAFPSGRTEKSRPSFSRHAVFLLLTAVMFAPDMQAEERKERSGRPVLYNLIVKEADPIDQIIRERYGAKYDVVEVRNQFSYRSPKLTKTRFPNPVYDVNNVEVSGSVRVCFVVTADGRLVDPFILGQANPLLEGPVLEVLKQFRATPARVNGAPAAVVDVLKFTFGPRPRRRLDTP
jgi:hypothetical protein